MTTAVADLPTLLDAATAADHAYRRARELVFDRHPDGVPHGDQLTDAQRQALDELRRAEGDFSRLREQQRRGGAARS